MKTTVAICLMKLVNVSYYYKCFIDILIHILCMIIFGYGIILLNVLIFLTNLHVFESV